MTAHALDDARLGALLLFAVLAALPLPAHAQAPTREWGTYLGGTGNDSVQALAVRGASEEAIAVGYTTSTDIPPATGTGTLAARDVLLSSLRKDGSLLFGPLIFGGSGEDVATGVTYGENDDIFVVGTTTSSQISGVTFPSVAGAYIKGADSFLARFSSDGSPQWFLYLSGSGNDVALGVTRLGSDIFITGYTDSSDFAGGTTPTQGGTDGFVLKLDARFGVPGFGSVVLIGGPNDDSLSGLMTTGFGDVVAVGTTASSSALSPIAPLNSFHGGPRDALVVKLDANFLEPEWITYLGTTGDDEARAIVPAPDNQYVIAGTSPGEFKLQDAFVTWLSTAGAVQRTQTLGGISNEEVSSATTDLVGNIYIGGRTNSSDFPLERAFDSTMEVGASRQEGFVAMIPAEGGAPSWSSFVGGDNLDAVKAIRFTASKRLVIAGDTSSASGLLTSPSAYDSTLSTPPDGFLVSVAVADISGPFLGTVHDRPQEDDIRQDVSTQTSTTSLAANWNPAFDPESEVWGYWCAFGTEAQPELLQPFTLNNPSTKTSCSLTGVTLQVGMTYYASVRAVNAAGLTRVVRSDGVMVVEPSSADGGADGGSGGADAGTDAGADAGTDAGANGTDGGPDGSEEDPEEAALLGWSCTAADAGLPMLLGLLALVLLARRRGPQPR